MFKDEDLPPATGKLVILILYVIEVRSFCLISGVSYSIVFCHTLIELKPYEFFWYALLNIACIG